MTTDAAEPRTSPPETPPVPTAPGAARFYAGLWRGVPRELLFLLVGFPVALAGFVVCISLFNTGVGTIIPFFVGFFVLVGALYVARGFATAQLTRLDWARMPAIRRVNWVDPRAANGFWGWLRSVLGNGHYWLALLHTVVINFALTLASFVVTITWVSLGVGGTTYWFWDRFVPEQHHMFYLSKLVFTGNAYAGANAGNDILDSFFYLLAGLIFLLTLPFVTRGLTRMHWWIASGLLGAWKSDALRQQVRELSAARGAASSAEGHSLRRLERDIHDGPQQRLVRMQMDLAAADRQLAADPEKARTLIAEAMQQSKDALEELRSLSRGFAPPILLDRGLVAALESAATRSPIHAVVVDRLAPGTAIPQEIERNAYFAGSEALTNAIKHSGATEIELRVSSVDGVLIVTVSDNGSGGATSRAGHGLAGLDERMRGSGGTLEVQSPAGGPTMVSAKLPLG